MLGFTPAVYVAQTLLAPDPTFWNLNADAAAAGWTLSNGGRTITGVSSGAARKSLFSAVSHTAGKRYFEITSTMGSVNTGQPGLGINADNTVTSPSGVTYCPQAANSGGYDNAPNGRHYRAGTIVRVTSALATNSTLMFAFEPSSRKLWIGNGGAWHNSGDPGAGTNWSMVLDGGTVFWISACADGTNSPIPPVITLRASAADCLYALPSGFTYW